MVVNNYPNLNLTKDTINLIESLESEGITVILMDGSTLGDKYSGKQTTLLRRGGDTRYKDVPSLDPFVKKVITDFAASRIRVSVESALCTDGKCLTALDGIELYSDERHLSPQGALFMQPFIESALTEARAVSKE
jgi:hypothetical protein